MSQEQDQDPIEPVAVVEETDVNPESVAAPVEGCDQQLEQEQDGEVVEVQQEVLEPEAVVPDEAPQIVEQPAAA